MIHTVYKKVTGIKRGQSKEKIKMELYGIVIVFLLDKELFKRNIDIKEFLNQTSPIFNSFKPYVYRSRTILIGRVLRVIEKEDKMFCYNLSMDIKTFIEKYFDMIDKVNMDNKLESESEENYTDKLFKRFKRRN